MPQLLCCCVCYAVPIQNRINVLLSRAKHGMYILGNASTLDKASQPPPEGSRRPAAPMWGNVLKLLAERHQIGPELEVGTTSYYTGTPN
jgi:hypothetical protein